MKYALSCLLLILIIFSCQKNEPVVPEEEDEEEVVIPDEDDDGGTAGESNADFPLILSTEDLLGTHYHITSVELHPSSGGGIFLTGLSSSANIGNTGNIRWTGHRNLFFESETRELFWHETNASNIRIFQVNDAGEEQQAYIFSNDHDIPRESSMIMMGSSIYFYWFVGDTGYEEIINIASLNSEGQLNWQKEIDFEDFVNHNVVGYNGHLFMSHGNRQNWARTDDVHVTILNESGEIVHSFELTSNLPDWDQAEPLVELQADDEYIYTNSTKNDRGLFRKSRIAKYTYSGDLVNEIEVLYSRDFYVVNKQVFTVGNTYEIDADIRKGHPFVIQLDENFEVQNDKRFDNIGTNWNSITVSDGVVYFYFFLSEWDPNRPLAPDSLYIDTLMVR